MADYYPLIARAIAGLDPSAPGESRRALYERARAALIAQLRSVEPPLSESEITRERLSLEEAVRKVESEAAQRARDASRSPDARGARAGDAFRATTRPNPRPGDAAPPAAGQPSPSSQRPPAASPPRPPAAPPPRTLRIDPPPIPRSQQRTAGAAAGDTGFSRYRGRRRRSRTRRRAGHPRRAQDLRQRALAIAGVRPLRAEHGEPRRRFGGALFV